MSLISSKPLTIEGWYEEVLPPFSNLFQFVSDTPGGWAEICFGKHRCLHMVHKSMEPFQRIGAAAPLLHLECLDLETILKNWFEKRRAYNLDILIGRDQASLSIYEVTRRWVMAIESFYYQQPGTKKAKTLQQKFDFLLKNLEQSGVEVSSRLIESVPVIIQVRNGHSHGNDGRVLPDGQTAYAAALDIEALHTALALNATLKDLPERLKIVSEYLDHHERERASNAKFASSPSCCSQAKGSPN